MLLLQNLENIQNVKKKRISNNSTSQKQTTIKIFIYILPVLFYARLFLLQGVVDISIPFYILLFSLLILWTFLRS